jgi:mRNA-degrading endonuclease RelE of RelBE toxin-antitoxin system
MPSYEIQVYGTAKDKLTNFETQEQTRITTAIKDLAEERQPAQKGNVKKLDTSDNLYRLQVGEYRVLYGLYRRFLIVIDIGHRDKFYDRIENAEDIFEEAKQEFATA